MESLNDVGSITYFNADGSIHETVTFNNQERYLEEAKEALKTRGITGWKCNTLSKDLNLHYELYKMIADEVDDDAMSRGEYARQHPELQKTEEIERTTQAAIRTDSKYQQAEQRRPKVSNLTNAIKEKISITEYAAMLGYHVKQISSDRYTLLEHDSMAIKFDKSGMEYFIVHEALKLYRDKRYMSEKASALPSELTETLLAANALLEKKLNAKSNQLLSSMGIELFVIQCILAHNLEIAPDEVERYRREAADFLRTNNRTLRMEEIL
jgi:hypothetical protein